MIWCHQGDAAACSGPLAEAAIVAALSRYTRDGGSLLLTGVAASLVAAFGHRLTSHRAARLRPRSRPGGAGIHRYDTSGLHGARPGPRRALDEQCRVPGVCRVPSAGSVRKKSGDCWSPAFRRLASGIPAKAGTPTSPARGELLARTPGGPENPLVEYWLGHGRVVAMAWRLSPHYHVAPATYRANFEQLAKNLLAYLGEPSAHASPGTSAGAKRIVGVRPSEWQALELAIDNLCDTFKDRYPAGREYRRRLAELKSSHDALLRRKAAGSESDAAIERMIAEFHRLNSRGTAGESLARLRSLAGDQTRGEQAWAADELRGQFQPAAGRLRQ